MNKEKKRKIVAIVKIRYLFIKFIYICFKESL